MIVTQNVEVDIDQVWGNLVGGHSGYWASSFKSIGGSAVQWYKDENYSVPNVQDFKVSVWEPHDGETVWYTVTVGALANAYASLKRDGWRHCDHYDIDEEDACTGDALLQMAAFGELIYG